MQQLLLLLLTNINVFAGACCAECTDNPSPAPAQATFACPSPVLPGAVCNATCDAGYIGTPSATCLANGTFSDVTGNYTLIREYLLVHLHLSKPTRCLPRKGLQLVDNLLACTAHHTCAVCGPCVTTAVAVKKWAAAARVTTAY
jgi:hypothetical protein